MLLRLSVFIHVLLASISLSHARPHLGHGRHLSHRNVAHHIHASRNTGSTPGTPTTPEITVRNTTRTRRRRCTARQLDLEALEGQLLEITDPSNLPSLALESAAPSSSSDPSSSGAPSSPAVGAPPEPSPTQAPPPSSPPPSSSRVSQLFPVPGFSRSWSTCPEAPNPRELSDGTLRPGNVLRTTMYYYGNAPDGRPAMVGHFPQGSFTFKNYPQGGFSFYAPGPGDVDLTTAKEATFGYSVFFPEGFAFNRGGKLPGLYGGNSNEEATSCSGGRRDTSCFSVRLMWRRDGDGEFYTYLPPGFDSNNRLCNVPPFSECNPTYGASVGRGSFRFPTGTWTTVAERVRLNDPGQSNGEIQLFVNGQSVLNVGGLVLRDSGAGRIRGIQAQTFFGGSTADWASPKDQDIYFSDFSVAITQSF
ncbi:alginate lyase [Coprinopsis cinerea okayama7|uniref:Alginate lyase n=1 Tax=Coprinopsis cinerea (strain Okayama-7 / 130 / ATCC MYA-4618 / FGSC 9003) TaxID=240176 RepID=D6RKS5_COPC7|nr:alginate lyase [Coprinopsis cinerea okayama7\|eukprot:XP_002911962.1 alginate lyase [Coprinopsis cinerea okayama7\